MDTLSPFDQYRRALAGQDSVWCSNLSAIFVRACTCFGIPARIFAIGNYQVSEINYLFDLAPGHATTEIFDVSLNRWVWIDLTFYMMGVETTDTGPINAAELQRCLNDPVKINLVNALEYSPVSHLQTAGPLLSSGQLGDMLWYFPPITIFSLYGANQTSGPPTYLNSNKNDLFPQHADLAIASIQSLPSAIGAYFQFVSGIKNLASYQSVETYTSDGTPLAPPQVSTNGTFSFAFAYPAAPVEQAMVFQINAMDRAGNTLASGSITIYYCSPQFYAQYGQTNTGVFIIDAFGFAYSSSDVVDWVADQASVANIAFARATWGGVVLPQASPTQQAQAVASALLVQLQSHRGASSIASGTPPFLSYQNAMNGLGVVGAGDIATIFSHACNCLGIPSRVVGLGSVSKMSEATNEIFDATLNRWIWFDLGDDIVGVAFADFGPIGSAEILRCVNYPERLANVTVSSLNPAAGSLSNGPASAEPQLSILLKYFDGTQSLLYSKNTFLINGKITPGDFNGDGKTDFIVQNGQNGALYTASGIASILIYCSRAMDPGLLLWRVGGSGCENHPWGL